VEARGIALMLRGIVIYGEEWVYRRVRGGERGERVWV